MPVSNPQLVRLQKHIADRGIASRREAERFIVAGKVKVNGVVVTKLGTKVDPIKDKVEVSGEAVKERDRKIYIALNKPKGYVTTSARKEEKKVTDLVKIRERIYPLGRLDKDTSGLLLFTNDGVLAFRLMHPRFGHEKEYEVTVRGFITGGALEKIEKGVTLDGEKTQPTGVVRISKNKFRLILKEGRYHQVKRVCQKVGSEVVELKRTRIENIHLGNLRVGEWRYLSEAEKSELSKRMGMK